MDNQFQQLHLFAADTPEVLSDSSLTVPTKELQSFTVAYPAVEL